METTLEEGHILTEEAYQAALNEFGPSFKAGMGGEAVRELLRKIDPEYLSRKLRLEVKDTKSEAQIKKLTKRLRVVEAFQRFYQQTRVDDVRSSSSITSGSSSVGTT